MWIGRVLGLLLLLVVGLLAVFWLAQRRLIYFPEAPALPPAASVAPLAADVSFTTEDGLTLGAWFFPAVTEATLAPVLVFPGNAGSREFRAPIATALARRGHPVLLIDYRGYGGNPGRPTETGLMRDARGARAWLAARPEVDAARIVYFGESLGAAVAVALAVEQPPAALVLRSPFTSLVEVGRVHYPWLPVRLLLRDRFPSIERIRGIDTPLLVIAGEDDSIVPARMSRRLFETAGQPVKRLISIPGAEHNDPRLTAGEAMIEEVVRFLSEQTATESRRVR